MEKKNAFLANIPASVASAAGGVERRLLSEYGSVFVAQGVQPPPKLVFRDEVEVSEFQSGVETGKESIGGFRMELQAPAMEALMAAAEAARRIGLSITPRGADSGKRSYGQTVELWASRVVPALRYWTERGKIDKAEALRISEMPPFDQVPVVLGLEEEGIFFSKDLSKSIIYSVAPPGASQHLSMLAFDVKEFDQPQVRSLLEEYFWYQTVVSDLPHFTYLGVPAYELPGLGLKPAELDSRRFWIPDLGE